MSAGRPMELEDAAHLHVRVEQRHLDQLGAYAARRKLTPSQVVREWLEGLAILPRSRRDKIAGPVKRGVSS